VVVHPGGVLISIASGWWYVAAENVPLLRSKGSPQAPFRRLMPPYNLLGLVSLGAEQSKAETSLSVVQLGGDVATGVQSDKIGEPTSQEGKKSPCFGSSIQVL